MKPVQLLLERYKSPRDHGVLQPDNPLLSAKITSNLSCSDQVFNREARNGGYVFKLSTQYNISLSTVQHVGLVNFRDIYSSVH